MTLRHTLALLALSLAVAQVQPARAARGEAGRHAKARRCRDIFCLAHRVDLAGTEDSNRSALTSRAVERTLRPLHAAFERCLVGARRADPRLRSAQIEFVVDASGRVLATRVNGVRRSAISRCLHAVLAQAKFPRSRHARNLASINMSIRQ